MAKKQLNIYSRYKTSKGQYPVANVGYATDADKNAVLFWQFTKTAEIKKESLRLEDLAGCLDESNSISAEEALRRITSFASISGPLLGRADTELINDWQVAIANAQTAISLQEAINKTKSFAIGTKTIEKISIYNTETKKNLFTAFFLTLRNTIHNTSDFEKIFPAWPWLKSFVNERGTTDYVFANLSEDEMFINLFLIACPEELSSSTFAALLCFLNSEQNTTDWLQVTANSPFAQSYEKEDYYDAEKLFKAKTLQTKSVVIGEGDTPHLQNLVQSIAALHLTNAHLDLFQSDNNSDYLSFDTYLESLWYSFAKSLNAIKVGYCAYCGRGFSTTGHRGMKKEYCSEECRMKAKNERNKEKRDTIRELYLSGATLEECAREYNPQGSISASKDSIMNILRRWKKLQHAITEETSRGTNMLAQRCLEDGIFNPKQVERLRRRGTK